MFQRCLADKHDAEVSQAASAANTEKSERESADSVGMDVRRFICISLACTAAVMIAAGCETPDIEMGQPPVRVESDRAGTGLSAKPGDIVTVDYEIFLPDGTLVLSDEGFRFQLGAGAVISAIDEAVEGMRVGGHRTIQCPPHRHWGRQGYGDGLIPPNTVLRIELSLVSVDGDEERARR
jgi:FKBP-type peptidyl-prolyl cis-trans isomerase FkpA